MPTNDKKDLKASFFQTARPFLKSVWLFPSLLLAIVMLLTALRISGSSMGVYYPVLYGANQKDPNLLAGHPQTIRSDEWLVNTQLTIAQSVAGYPTINHNVHGGTDMALAGDVPYKDWSAVFRPQNLIFFVLPLAYALAFKWWLLLFLVIVSCYFFFLRFLPHKRLLAAFVGTAVGLSPFVFWWYITSALAPIFYGFFILIIGMRIVNIERVPLLKKLNPIYSLLLYVFVLSYLLISFALILYPPFQIPIVLCVAAFLMGYMLDKYRLGRELLSKESLKVLGTFFASLVLAGSVIALFLHTHNQAIRAVQHTVYPGSRQTASGNTPLFEIFSTHLQPQLERTNRAPYYYANQSEASSFLLFLPFLLLPGFILTWLEYRQRKKLNWSLLLVQLVGILFLANLFVAANFQPIYRLFFLGKVPHARLFIGLGFVGILQLLLVMKSLASMRAPKRFLNWLSGIYAFACFLVLVWTGNYVNIHYPLFIGRFFMVILAIYFSIILFCVLSRKFFVMAALSLIFSIYSVYNVQPLYRGLEPLYPSKLTKTIERVSNPGDTWVSLDSIYFENVAMIGRRNSISGVQAYPNVNLWRQLEYPKGDYIYNRYAHVLFSSSPAVNDRLHLIQFDNFYVKFDCSIFIERNVQYALAAHPLENTCVTLVEKVRYPAATFYIYRVN